MTPKAASLLDVLRAQGASIAVVENHLRIEYDGDGLNSRVFEEVRDRKADLLELLRLETEILALYGAVDGPENSRPPDIPAAALWAIAEIIGRFGGRVVAVRREAARGRP